jgi:hypothetical protein
MYKGVRKVVMIGMMRNRGGQLSKGTRRETKVKQQVSMVKKGRHVVRIMAMVIQGKLSTVSEDLERVTQPS